MSTDDPRIMRLCLYGETVFVPSADAWRDVLNNGELDGKVVPLPQFVRHWLDEYARYGVAMLGVRTLKPWPREWSLLPLLKLGDTYLRVHFEDVICEHCGQRCGPSATPDTTQYAGSGLSPARAAAEFKPFPVQRCPHCAGLLQRRQTVWLANESAA